MYFFAQSHGQQRTFSMARKATPDLDRHIGLDTARVDVGRHGKKEAQVNRNTQVRPPCPYEKTSVCVSKPLPCQRRRRHRGFVTAFCKQCCIDPLTKDMPTCPYASPPSSTVNEKKASLYAHRAGYTAASLVNRSIVAVGDLGVMFGRPSKTRARTSDDDIRVLRPKNLSKLPDKAQNLHLHLHCCPIVTSTRLSVGSWFLHSTVLSRTANMLVKIEGCRR